MGQRRGRCRGGKEGWVREGIGVGVGRRGGVGKGEVSHDFCCKNAHKGPAPSTSPAP